MARAQIGRNGWPVMVALCHKIYANGRLGRASSDEIARRTGLTYTQISRGMRELRDKGIIAPVIRKTKEGYRRPDRSAYGHVAQYCITRDLWAAIIYGPFMHEAYECGMVPKHYDEDIETIAPWEEAGRSIMNPNPEFLEPLASRQILACIGYHFRADHFCDGSLEEDSLPNGSLLQLIKAYRCKALEEIAGYDDATISKALLRAFKKMTC